MLVIFGVAGCGLTTWLSRVPGARESLGASTVQMGILAFGIAIGSIVGFMIGGRAGARFPRWIVMMLSLLGTSLGVLITGIGAGFAPHFAIAFIGVLLIGAGNGCCNVVMNVEAAAIELDAGRPQMPWFHAAYSVGGVVGAAVGALAASSGVAIGVHLAVAAVALAVIAGIATSALPRRTARAVQANQAIPPTQATPTTPPSASPPRSAWRDRRTLAIGVVVLGMSFANGSANDWLALGMVDGHSTSAGTAALATSVFTVAVVIARLLGVSAVQWLGNVAAVRGSAVLAVAGILIFVLVPSVPAAFAGAVLWGLGVALGFPVAMSAAAAGREAAAPHIAVVATIGYAGSLVGPPVIGFLAEHTGILHALFVVLAMAILSGIFTPALRRVRP